MVAPTFSNILLQHPLSLSATAQPDVDDSVTLRMDMSWENALALTIHTELYLHYPVGFAGSLPIQLSFTISKLSGLVRNKQMDMSNEIK